VVSDCSLIAGVLTSLDLAHATKVQSPHA